MMIAVKTNVKTAHQCWTSQGGLGLGFNIAIQGGSVMGLSLVSLGVLALFVSVETAVRVRFPYTSHVKEEQRKPMTHAVCLQFCQHFPLVKFHVLQNGNECICAPSVHDVPGRVVTSPVRVMTRRRVEMSTSRQ